MPARGSRFRSRDDQGRELPPGQTGEICVIGPAVFAGYYQNPEANRKSFRDGWFRTGDLGHMDDAGFLYITGRESDMFISGGSNVYPREIEEKILTHPAISEVAVLGLPDPLWGEIGWAVCVAHAHVTEDELAAFLDGKLSRYKMPKRFPVLGRAAEIGLWQDHQENDPAGTGGARPDAAGGTGMTRMIHPGPRAALRVQARRAALRKLTGITPAGQTVMQAVGDIFAQAGCKGGILWLDGVVLELMRLRGRPPPRPTGCMARGIPRRMRPKAAGRSAARPRRWGGKTARRSCIATASGRAAAIPKWAICCPLTASSPRTPKCAASAPRIPGSRPCPMMRPHSPCSPQRARAQAAGCSSAFCPAKIVVTAIEALALRFGIRNGRVYGVGSIDHIRFAEGHRMDCHATELRLDGARITEGQALIRIEVVDIDGNIATGMLTRGDNPVGVTLELIIEPQEAYL
ncbi:AMP-binding protein [Paracoccus sp. DMF-8]|uniref:AMP-binding enzyme n=1 Tax=Paracoccus sp. DMF-8 TaxID=3019445 RepID=UPI0023E8BA66|nr:AMP-binding protein [Paracoccus sp. DMF-8]MDF3604854.1 AMP-binding protein [Paracoccus sp. DMF-8]